MAVLKQIKFGTSTTPIAKTVVKGTGVVSVTNTKDFSNEKTEDKDYSYDIDVNVDDSTIVKSENKLAVGNVPAAQVTVADEDGVFTAGNVETALKELKDNIASVDGKAKSYTIVKVTQGLASNVKEQYKLQETVGKESNFVGEPINIYKDSSLESVALNGQSLDFTYILADGNKSTVGVDVSTFLAESEFADGLQVTDHVVSVKLGQGLEFGDEAKNKSIKVKIDSTSESFLTVGKEGVKLAGVQNAIDAKVAALDVTNDKDVAGQYVAAIEETDGFVAVKTRANVSEAVLNNYAKGSDASAVAASDTINQAISKLEKQVDAAKAATTAAIEALDVTDAAVEGQYVSQVSETDGKIAVSRLNVSDAVLNGYAKGEKPTSTEIAATDDVKGALAKLEHQVDDAKAATTSAIKELDNEDTATEGQVVTAVSTADGIAQPTKANFAGIKLGGFAQDADVTGEIASTDTLAAALNKLENKIDAAADDHTVVKHADSNTHVTVSGTPNGNGSMTYTVTENDIASAQALTEEIGRAQKAEKEIADKVGLTGAEGSRTFAPTQNYGTGSTSVVDNMQKLDTQLKKVTDDLAAVQYKVSGTTLEFFGISENKTV